MLPSLLPGLRELRAPLAAGYIWLFSVWLGLHSSLPKRAEAHGIVDAIYDLGDVISVLGLGVAISFIAYLLGAISQSMLDDPLRFAGRVLRPALLLPGDPARFRELVAVSPPPLQNRTAEGFRGEISKSGLLALHAFLRGLLQEKVGKASIRVQGTIPDDLTMRYVLGIFSEFRVVQTRLIGESNELFTQFDRFRAEAEFRRSMVVPLSVLVILVAVQTTWIWLFGFLIQFLLYRDAVRLQESAGDVLADAVAAAKVSSPSLERLDQDIGADLHQTDLRGAKLQQANFLAANLEGANLSGADLSLTVLFGANLANADLSGCTLEGAYLVGADLSGADLTAALLVDANLGGAQLAGASGVEANFSGARLIGASMKAATMSGAFFEYSDLSDTDLANADLTRAALTGSSLFGAVAQGAKFAGAKLRLAELANADLSKCDLSGADMTGADLRNTNLEGADLSRAVLTEARAKKARLRGANLGDSISMVANFSEADLREADLSRANLKRTRMPQTNLMETKLCSANLPEVSFHRANLHKADLSRAFLHHADFTGADLANANFTGASLHGAKLMGADLTETTFEGADLSAALLRRIRPGGGSGDMQLKLWGNLLRRVTPRNAERFDARMAEVGLADARVFQTNFTSAKASARTTWPDGFDPAAEGVVVAKGRANT